MTTTEQFLQYLAERARAVKREGWYWTYPAWRWIRGFTDQYGDPK